MVPNHSRGQEGLHDTMELLDVLEVIDTEKCRKKDLIRVESALIRVKVLRECCFGASERIFRLMHRKKVI